LAGTQRPKGIFEPMLSEWATRASKLHASGSGKRGSMDSQTANGWLRPLGLILSGVATLLTIWALLVVAHVPRQREHRILARTPVIYDSRTAGVKPVARWIRRYDELGDKQFRVVFIESLEPSAAPPPGLSRWPAAGEAFVSPGLLAADRVTRTRYGRFAGTIGGQGLADPDEWLVYARPSGSSAMVGARGTEITGFAPPQSKTTSGGVFDTTAAGLTKDLWWLLAMSVAPATFILLIAVSRSGRRPRGVKDAVRSATGPVTCGVLAGASAAWATTVTGIRLPIVGRTVAAADLTALRPSIAFIAPATVLIALAVVAAATAIDRRTPRLRRKPVGRTGATDVTRLRRMLWAMAVAGTATSLTVTLPVGEHHETFFVAAAVTWIVAALALPPATRVFATWLTRAARTAKLRNLEAAGRLLGGSSRPIAATAAVLTLGIGLITHIHVWQTPHATGLDAARMSQSQVGSRVLMISTVTAPSANATTRFRAALPANVGVLATTTQSTPAADTPERAVFHGSCSTLAMLAPLSNGCPNAPVPFRQAFANGPVIGAIQGWFIHPDDRVVADDSVRPPLPLPRRYMLVNPLGQKQLEAIKHAAYTTLPTAQVDRAGDLWIDSARPRIERMAWLHLFGLAGLMLILLAGLIPTAEMLLRSSAWSDTKACDTTLDGPPPMAVCWTLVLPPTLAVVMAGLLAIWLGNLQSHLQSSEGVAPGFLALIVVLTIIVAGAVSLLTACGRKVSMPKPQPPIRPGNIHRSAL
jgi:hypothetical protein